MDIESIKKQIEALKKTGKSKAKVKAIEEEIEKIEKNKSESVAADPVERESDEKTSESVEDRSAFNCEPCKGEGLIYPRHKPYGEICAACHGTGKRR